jgi:hypothetical protein
MTDPQKIKSPETPTVVPAKPDQPKHMPKEIVKEIGGRTDGPEPTRYGDWEHNGKCVDF